MLTITNPEVLHTLIDLPGGLLPTRKVGASRITLIVKSMREIAVTAQLRRFFRFYLIPLRAGDVDTHGLLTAFFDDHDEPLTIRTLFFDEEFTRDVFQVLSSNSFDIHFFDENNRELLGFRAENPDATRFRSIANTIRFVPPTLDLARQFHDDMTFWFGARSTADDNAALTINLLETLFPHNLYPRSQNPGDFNERDIEMGLHRAFSGDQVYRNPVRANEGREFVDVLVATVKTVLLIQAKDSPFTESTLNRLIGRKKATTAAHIRKAAAQLKGSINHLRSDSSIEIITDGQRCDVSMSGREVFGLVIVKELFDPERSACSRLVFTVFEGSGIPCLLLDYLEFQQLTFFRRTEESFVGTLWEIFSAAREHGVFPRTRFGLVADGTTVYSPRRSTAPPDSTTNKPASAVLAGSHGTTAPLPQDRVAGGPARVAFREGVGADWLGVVVDRTDVEALDVSRTATTLSSVLANRDTIERFRGRVDLAFHGYSNDPRELYEIPEVRHFCTKLDDAFPFWFFFLSAEGVTLGVIACCLCSVTKVRPGVVSFGPDLLQFMTRHFEALNWLFDSFSLDERHNVEISGQLTEYFGRFEPMR